jgi:Spy/CpxP family protein refolding chaperone
MKHLIVYALLLLVSSETVHAQSDSEGDGNRQTETQTHAQKQNPGQGQPGGRDRIAQMQKNLDLSDEQVRQMRKIREDGGDRRQMRAVLTDEQRALMRERRRQSQGQKGKVDPSRYYTQPQDSPPADPDEG